MKCTPLLLFALCLCLAMPWTDTPAQPQTRAYAPENLSQLSREAQIRAIEREYADQSGGRRIPDDQLQFYLDQIRIDRWTFSEVRADIARSLRGGNNGRPPLPGRPPARPPVDPPIAQREITCESRDRRYRECATPFRGRARLVRQLSEARCVNGRTWGSRNGLVWVDDGCRAIFAADYGGGRPEPGFNVTCASRDHALQTCAWPAHYGRPRLIERLSNAECRQGRSWGYDERRGLWVSQGCRARFGVR